MGYKIVYDHYRKKGFYRSYNISKGFRRLSVLLVILLVAGILLTPARKYLKSFLLPGDEMVTESAFETMVDNIKGGSSFYDAAIAFCREIIYSEQENLS